jgi:hypothetical protein
MFLNLPNPYQHVLKLIAYGIYSLCPCTIKGWFLYIYKARIDH